jgi:hypothetical protein
MHQSFAAGKNNFTNTQFPEVGYMILQYFNRNLLLLMICFPDITHNAPAITATMGHHHDNWQIIDLVGSQGS